MDDVYSEQFGVARIQDSYVRFHWSISNLKSLILNVVPRISNGSFGLSYLQIHITFTYIFSYVKEIRRFCFECLKSR